MFVAKRPPFFAHIAAAQFIRLVVVLLLLTLLLVWSGMYWVVQSKRQDALDAEKQQNINLAHTLAEQTLRVIQSVDQATLRLADALASGQFRKTDLVRFARETGLADSIITQLSYVGVDGKFIASNIDMTGQKTGPVDLSEREHIKVHLAPATHPQGTDQGLFFGKTLVGKVSGKRTIQLSRKLTTPTGAVKGVAVVSLNPDYFEQNFKVLNLDAQGQVAIVGSDGFVRAAVTGGQSAPAQFAPAFWIHEIHAASDASKLVAAIGESNQVVFAAKRIGAYPVYLVVQTSATDALSDWYTARSVAFALTALFSLALVAAALSYIHGVRKLSLVNQGLETKVLERTKALSETLENLKSAQSQLIQSEKMATLGHIVANVAHEINTPLGAVQSSGETIAVAFSEVLAALPPLVLSLDPAARQAFFALIDASQQPSEPLSTREERKINRELLSTLTAAAVAEPQLQSDMLLSLKVHHAPLRFMDVLLHQRALELLRVASQIAAIMRSTENINLAVARVSKIVFALKSFSHSDHSGVMQAASVSDGIETVLAIYGNQLKQGVEVIRAYEDLPMVLCFADALVQLWTNLIHNALQAMQYKGTLRIAVTAKDKGLLVAISDTGPGIPEGIRTKIFDPFFTTKPVGEGSGLGLDIARKIVQKHHGTIAFHTELGVGTTFSVWLPVAPTSQQT